MSDASSEFPTSHQVRPESRSLQNLVLGAIVLGIVVNAVMNVAITMKTGAPWSSGFVRDLIPNLVFYALPVASYLARTTRRA
jgi:hypothetical protein